jgi:quercetin dioxygenase-like cupin family protein
VAFAPPCRHHACFRHSRVDNYERIACPPHPIYDESMTNRRDVLAGALAMLAGAGARAQDQSRQSGLPPVFQHDLPNITMDGWEVNVSVVDIPPGREGRPHHHPGFVLAYVLEGAVVTKISDQPETTYQAGQMFYEPPGSTHQVSRNVSKTEPAKLLAMIFAKKGLPLVTPA